MKHLGLRSGAKDIASQEQLGAGAMLATALTVSPVASGYAEVVVAAAGITAGSKVFAMFSGGLDEENDVEEWADSGLSVVGVPEPGQIRFALVSGNGSPFCGVFNVDYQVAA